MERDLDEVLASQEKMLARLGRPAVPREQMKRSFVMHLEKLHDWLPRQAHLKVLRIRYDALVKEPSVETERVCAFLDGKVDTASMMESVDPQLYRNRKV
jgi:hypothetical protein